MKCSECDGPLHPNQPCPPEAQRKRGSLWCFNDQFYIRDEGQWTVIMQHELHLDPRWHPMQPVQLDDKGVVRFRGNKIVSMLLQTSKLDLNDLDMMMQEDIVSQEDYTHLMQLIGYSVDGYAELDSSPEELVQVADTLAERLVPKRKASE
jgi:hypothetical protein